ncbi:hypothetical protein ADP71_02960 [Vitreoscilla sp. C1]|uniref:AI-2E family transporter n=1 Tax=Vitreoscilla sp. (strain C1) TaxID=96942 RepID=UPI00148EEBE9|nr:AI-2E family transporter [Vitreoscilla sp. C1]AUZ04109.2 hypothetical protein ADP71_02960 [Vitreoscilla sp. C1]
MNQPNPHLPPNKPTPSAENPHDNTTPQPSDTTLENQHLMAQIVSLLPNLRILIGLCIAALVISGLYFGRSLLIPLALATFLGFLLHPIVLKLKHWGLPHLVSVMTVITVCLALLIAGTTYLGMQLVNLSQQLPTYQDTIQEKAQNLKTYTEGPSVWDGAISTFSIIQQTISGTAPNIKHDDDQEPKNSNEAAITEVKIVSDESNPINAVAVWIQAVAEPIVTAGIALLFVILILINRSELRDRILLILGRNLNVATDMLNEAAQRIGTYLRMQLLVNASYGIPMAIGLWFIGVPAAFLWGTIAVVMRFIPYVGPVISSIFPLALAFAVDPSWDMVLWTIGLIVVLELISNNVIEPWLYGSSTGLSTLSIILAATFWTAIWGPVGLILSTPMTACLLVLSRSIPSLRFIEVIIGSDPVLETSQRFYQRLLAQNIAEAVELAENYIEADLPHKADTPLLARKVIGFYDDVAIEALRLFSSSHDDIATARHRLRMNLGIAEFNQHMYKDYPVNDIASVCDLNIVCLGARWYVDVQAAAMVTHALQLSGFQAQTHNNAFLQNQNGLEQIDWENMDVLCLSIFNAEPMAQIRLIARHLRAYEHLHIIVIAWNGDIQTLNVAMQERFELTAIVDSIHSLNLHLPLLPSHHSTTINPTLLPDNEAERLQALVQCDVFNAAYLPIYQHIIKQTLHSLNVDYAQIAWVDEHWVHTPANTLLSNTQDTGIAREQSIATYIVYENEDLILEDIQNDPRFDKHSELAGHKIRFYAGVPLRNKKGLILGCLSIMNHQSRSLNEQDLEVLHSIADYLMQLLREPNQMNALIAELQETASIDSTH